MSCDGYLLGTAPTQSQSILGVLLRAIYNHIIIIIQLLLSAGSTQVICLMEEVLHNPCHISWCAPRTYWMM